MRKKQQVSSVVTSGGFFDDEEFSIYEQDGSLSEKTLEILHQMEKKGFFS